MLIRPPDSSWINLLRPSPTSVKPKREGSIKIIYKNCGSLGDIVINSKIKNAKRKMKNKNPKFTF